MNVLVLTSDQHNKFARGEVGNGVPITPAIDRLAAEGTSFEAAWTNNPICMPARATLATGLYGHSSGFLDNGSAYDGSHPSWGHRVSTGGFTAHTFGKLHFIAEADSGFDMHLPLQAKRAYMGALMGWARDKHPPTRAMRSCVETARAGEFEYTSYDRHTTEAAINWLTDPARHHTPWAAHVSWAYPHYPYRVPEQYVADFDPQDVDLPVQWSPDAWLHGPEIDHRRRQQSFDTPVGEAALRNMRWIYHGMVRFMDEQVGLVLDALDRAGLAEDTLVIYTTDHGDMLGEKGMFMKGLMYESSVGVPMLMRGPGLAEDAVNRTAVTLADIAPTVLDAVGLGSDPVLPGDSLLGVARCGDNLDRIGFSEYHGPGSIAASYAVRQGTWKYTEYVTEGAEPELFDLDSDPSEQHNLAEYPASQAKLDAMASALRTILDPVAVDAEVREWQQRMLAEAGGLPERPTPPKTRTGLGGYTVPPDEIMAVVGNPDDPDWQ